MDPLENQRGEPCLGSGLSHFAASSTTPNNPGSIPPQTHRPEQKKVSSEMKTDEAVILFDKPAYCDAFHSPQDSQDSLFDILQRFGLEKDDLQYLLSFPEDQINSENLRHILNQINLQKESRAGPCPDPQSVKVCSGIDGSSSSTDSEQSLSSMPSNTLEVSKVTEYGHTGNYSLAGTNSGRMSRGSTRGSGRLSPFDAPGSSSYKEPLHEITSKGKTSAVVPSLSQSGPASSFRLIKNFGPVPPVSNTANQLQTQLSQLPKRTLTPVLSLNTKSPHLELCWSGRVDNEFSPLVKMNDGVAATAMVFPHVCFLCNTKCDTMMEWLAHQNTPLHLENCKVLRTQFPDWDGELKPVSPCHRYSSKGVQENSRSSSRSRSLRRRPNRRRPSSRSHSLSCRSKNVKRSSPSSPERLVKRVLKSSGVESLSNQCQLETFSKTPMLTKEKLTSSSSSAVRYPKESEECTVLKPGCPSAGGQILPQQQDPAESDVSTSKSTESSSTRETKISTKTAAEATETDADSQLGAAEEQPTAAEESVLVKDAEEPELEETGEVENTEAEEQPTDPSSNKEERGLHCPPLPVVSMPLNTYDEQTQKAIRAHEVWWTDWSSTEVKSNKLWENKMMQYNQFVHMPQRAPANKRKKKLSNKKIS